MKGGGQGAGALIFHHLVRYWAAIANGRHMSSSLEHRVREARVTASVGVSRCGRVPYSLQSSNVELHSLSRIYGDPYY
ncbi:hypothetical protein J6590_032869 [Homalodisca vitripennis]|nr:hypothetical protein J6590_032869 [Homalodisca vitripennis]